jgi:hypothetical protein
MAQKSASTVATSGTTDTDAAKNNEQPDTLPESASSHSVADEDVVRDILEELDRERSKRAELEVKIRQLVEAQSAAADAESKKERKKINTDRKSKSKEKSDEKIPSSHDFLAMQVQVEGYQQLVDVLTKGKPAIAAAAKNENTSASPHAHAMGRGRNNKDNTDAKKTLPLHVVRLLEVIPWHPLAREHIFGKEGVYEWQVYDKRERKWHGNVRAFPSLFKSLPITRPKPGGNSTIKEQKDRSLLLFLAGGGEKGAATAPSKHGVLTNAALTQMLNIETGFPLPNDGATWQWIGGWRVDKRVTVDSADADGGDSTSTTLRHKVDCDDDGWSYAREAQHFISNPTEWAWDHSGGSGENGSPPERRIRRRKWTRPRVLVDYPYASERTQNYLKLLAENSRLSVTSSKISDQLVETKMTLTETEQELMRIKDETSQQIEVLKADIGRKDALLKAVDSALLKAVDSNGSHGDGGGPIHEFLTRNEQVKEIGSKISQWVGSSARKASEDAGSHASTEGTTSQLDKSARCPESPKFGWGKKFGGGALLEKIKQSQTNTGKSQEKPQNSESGIFGESTENEKIGEDPSDEPAGESG